MHIKRRKSLRAQFKSTIAKKFRNLPPEHALFCLLYITQTLNEICGSQAKQNMHWLYGCSFSRLKIKPLRTYCLPNECTSPMGDSVGDSWRQARWGKAHPQMPVWCCVGTLTTVSPGSFFLDMKGKGCEIKKRCHGDAIRSVRRPGAGVGVVSDHFGAISEQQRLNL